MTAGLVGNPVGYPRRGLLDIDDDEEMIFNVDFSTLYLKLEFCGLINFFYQILYISMDELSLHIY